MRKAAGGWHLGSHSRLFGPKLPGMVKIEEQALSGTVNNGSVRDRKKKESSELLQAPFHIFKRSYINAMAKLVNRLIVLLPSRGPLN